MSEATLEETFVDQALFPQQTTIVDQVLVPQKQGESLSDDLLQPKNPADGLLRTEEWCAIAQHLR